MKLYRIAHLLAVASILCVLAANGCKSPEKESSQKPIEANKPVQQAVTPAGALLTLKFVPEDTTKYKLTMSGQNKVRFEGNVPAKTARESGETINTLEMTFTQRIKSVDSNGNAVAGITIDRLKYLYKIRENTLLDFDSAKTEDANNPMAKLVGLSYTMEITPSGKVAKVIDVNQAQAAVAGDSEAQKTALRLLQPDAVKERHGILVLPDTEKNKLQMGGIWSSVKTFHFGKMGSASYKRIYTLKQVDNINNLQIATVEMKAEPTSETAGEVHKEHLDKDLSKGFDNKGQYQGQLRFDSTSGKIEKASEDFYMEWVTAKPPSRKMDEAEPTTMVMSATRFYSLERIE